MPHTHTMPQTRTVPQTRKGATAGVLIDARMDRFVYGPLSALPAMSALPASFTKPSMSTKPASSTKLPPGFTDPPLKHLMANSSVHLLQAFDKKPKTSIIRRFIDYIYDLINKYMSRFNKPQFSTGDSSIGKNIVNVVNVVNVVIVVNVVNVVNTVNDISIVRIVGDVVSCAVSDTIGIVGKASDKVNEDFGIVREVVGDVVSVAVSDILCIVDDAVDDAVDGVANRYTSVNDDISIVREVVGGIVSVAVSDTFGIIGKSSSKVIDNISDGINYTLMPCPGNVKLPTHDNESNAHEDAVNVLIIHAVCKYKLLEKCTIVSIVQHIYSILYTIHVLSCTRIQVCIHAYTYALRPSRGIENINIVHIDSAFDRKVLDWT